MIEIIAEIGVNHDGNVRVAEDLIRDAKRHGANVVKFQVWKSENVYSGVERERMKALELTRHELEHLKKYSDCVGIEFMATPDEYDDAVFLKDIGVKRIKIGSQNIINLPMLKKVAALGLPLIVSTGAATKEEVTTAVITLHRCGLGTDKRCDFSLLHCVAAYPAPLAEMNLCVLNFLRESGRRVGLSDHCMNPTAALIALGLGATIFEKHLTYNRCAIGPDHMASLDAHGFHEYVGALRAGEIALGDGVKRIMPCEGEARDKNLRVLSKYAPETVIAHHLAT